MSASSADIAIDVTEAAMLAALEAVRDGETMSPAQAEGILIGLTRAAARWAVMISPPMMDGGFEKAFALCLSQERRNAATNDTVGNA